MSTLTSPAPAVSHRDLDDSTGEAVETASEARMVFNGRLRRLHVIRHTIIACAGLGIATVFGPWWHTEFPAQRLSTTLGGRGAWIELGEGSATTSGLEGGQLTRVLLVAAAAVAVWYVMGRLWWWSVPALVWATTPPLSLAPPSSPPAGRVGDVHGHLASLTSETVWLTANRATFYALLCLAVAAAVQAFLVRRAAKAVARSEGRPAGIWEKHILPRLAEAGVSLTIDPKNGRRNDS